MPELVKPTADPFRVRDENGPPKTDVVASGDRLVAAFYPEPFQRGFGYGHPIDQILRSYAEAEANARLFVQAVNERPAVVAALRAMIEVYREEGSDDDNQPAVVRQALAALNGVGDSTATERDLCLQTFDRIVRKCTDEYTVRLIERALDEIKALRQKTYGGGDEQ